MTIIRVYSNRLNAVVVALPVICSFLLVVLPCSKANKIK